MSVAYYIVVDREPPGFDPFVNGKAIAHNIEALNAICDRAGVPQLATFQGQSEDEMMAMLGDVDDDDDDDDNDDDNDDGDSDDDHAGRTWFAPADGRRAVEALTAALATDSNGVNDIDDVIDELREYRDVLAQAEQHGLRFHLALDI